MSNHKKILTEVAQLKTLGHTMIEKAIRIEALLSGEGKLPLSTHQGAIAKEAALAIHKRARTLYK